MGRQLLSGAALVRLTIGTFVLLSALVDISAAWPQWRGPDRSNASREIDLLQEWPTNGPPLLWRATGIGLGIHAVSVAQGLVLTSGNREGGEFVFALEVQTGEKRWAARVDDAIEENRLMRWLTQRSPTIDEERVYAFTSNGTLWCLRTSDGQKLWQVSYPKLFGSQRPSWGFTDHPLVDGERLIVSPFGTNAAIAALDKHSGRTLWKTQLKAQPLAGYAALVESRAGGIRHFVLFHGRGLAGFAADDGRLLWECDRPRTRIASTYTPLPHDDVILSPNGYGGGLVIFKIASGDPGLLAEQVLERTLNLDPFQDSTVAAQDRIYLVQSGAPVCLDATTGETIWRSHSNSRGPRAALTWAEDHLYIRTLDGKVSLVQTASNGAVPKGRFLIPEHEKSLGVTSPVVAESRLWLRDDNRLFCYDLRQSGVVSGGSSPRQVAIGLTDAELGVDSSAQRAPRVGVDRAPDAVFVPTPQDIVERMLEVARVKPTDTLVDLGSGDGRFVLTAARKHGCKAVGYEIDAQLVASSQEWIVREQLGALAAIKHQDLFTVDLSGADVVTVFLYPRLMERLVPQFAKLKPGSRIVSHQFEIPGVPPDETLVVESTEDGSPHRILLWTTPLRPAR